MPTETKPATTEPCRYWQRQQFRHADDHGFGYSPGLSEQAAAHREAEDAEDPPCGLCLACQEQKADPAWHLTDETYVASVTEDAIDLVTVRRRR